MLRRFILPSMYRGEQFYKVCWAPSRSEASRIFEVSVYEVKNYAMENDGSGEPFKGVKACTMDYLRDKELVDLQEYRVSINRRKNLIER